MLGPQAAQPIVREGTRGAGTTGHARGGLEKLPHGETALGAQHADAPHCQRKQTDDHSLGIDARSRSLLDAVVECGLWIARGARIERECARKLRNGGV